MGTGADFYIGRGKNAEWIGSIFCDGYPEGIQSELFLARNEREFRLEVELLLKERENSRKPNKGWPWPWNDSLTTDYSYCWDGKVLITCFGYGWITKEEIDEHNRQYKTWEKLQLEEDAIAQNEDREPEEVDGDPGELWGDDKTCVFPDMKSKKGKTKGPDFVIGF
jgi:hypothetical protein